MGNHVPVAELENGEVEIAPGVWSAPLRRKKEPRTANTTKGRHATKHAQAAESPKQSGFPPKYNAEDVPIATGQFADEYLMSIQAAKEAEFTETEKTITREAAGGGGSGVEEGKYEEPQPPQPDQALVWACRACTFINKKNARECATCFTVPGELPLLFRQCIHGLGPECPQCELQAQAQPQSSGSRRSSAEEPPWRGRLKRASSASARGGPKRQREGPVG